MVLIFVQPRALTDALREALKQADVKHAAFEAACGLKHPQLAQWLAGQGHISLGRLWLIAPTPIGQAFWRAFLPLLAAHVGAENTDAVAAELHTMRRALATLIDKMQPRMVRAQLAHAERRKQA